MDEALYRALGEAKAGYVIAPAGCGKTEAIARAVKDSCVGKQLVLTHTNAGVGALKKRFKKHEVPTSEFHIETISGWALSWVRRYPKLSVFIGKLPIPESEEWPLVYAAAEQLLTKPFVQYGIKNSYTGIIVDEYQDCTLPMHRLITALKALLPCRILGDPLQGIFGLNETLVEWSTVESDFAHKIGDLRTPYRWVNVNNRALGDWLIQARDEFQNNRHPNYQNSPIKIEKIEASAKAAYLQSLVRRLQGSICVIGAKHGNMRGALESALVKVGLSCVEPNDLSKLGAFLSLIAKGGDASKQGEAAIQLISRSFSGLEGNKNFVEGILCGTLKRRPSESKKRALYDAYCSGYSHPLLLDIIAYISSENINCKRRDSIRYLKKTLEQHIETGENILEIFSREIAHRKAVGKYHPERCIGTTLLLKGLEFDHAIILYEPNNSGWKNVNDMYVALTRGSKSVHIIETT